ncbi:MAG: VOC family protein [Actinomycetota bacterium]|nr:VOC family protein [Actinomycetota bacterium]
MTAREEWFPGEPCWIDLYTKDVAKARAFYSAVLGWKAGEQAEQFGGYFMFLCDGVPVAGCMSKNSADHTPDAWTIYLATANAEESLGRGASHGATVVVPAMAVGDLGTMGMMVDPSGAAVGVWAPQEFSGFGRLDEPGTPKWFELHTGDYESAVDFYRGVFGWEISTVGDSPGFQYATADHQGRRFAGILQDRESSPRWEVRFGVRDTEAALAAALANGGSLKRPTEETMYGRIGHLADPTGSAFVIQPATQAP